MPTPPWAVSSTQSALQFSGWCPGCFFVRPRRPSEGSWNVTPAARTLTLWLGWPELVEGGTCVKVNTSAPRSRSLYLPHTVRRPRPLRTGLVAGPQKREKNQDQDRPHRKTTARTGSVLGLMPSSRGFPSIAGTLDGSWLLPELVVSRFPRPALDNTWSSSPPSRSDSIERGLHSWGPWLPQIPLLDLFMWSDLLNCRGSLHNRRHDEIHTLFHDPFLDLFMWSDLLTKAVDSNKVVEMYTGGTQQMKGVPTQLQEAYTATGGSSALVFASTTSSGTADTTINSEKVVERWLAADARRAHTPTENVRRLEALSSCSHPLAAATRDTELIAVKRRLQPLLHPVTLH